jgi:hypothetical protein
MRMTIVILAALGVLILVRVVAFPVAPSLALALGFALRCLTPSLLALFPRAGYGR